ncbi:b-glycosidase [Massilia sp. Dwa41.01b]|uniref:b-glycosidase n=1 Tax=unclassified Massilia TaxID=2609279 RepID=UPI00160290A4|nr:MULTISPECIES: b-glycosidase [unclassified Massilia]QNA88269.1 b-glycosidase [Massilia sp. Dwa41.01b]QNA99171.1 b-glycosidase [Massilia sp. Se16.2.3]
MASRPGIFPTFFLSGFECSSFLWSEERVRRDLVAETEHDRHTAEDYRILNSLGIGVAREGIPWPLVDRGEGYDFSRIDPPIEAMNASKITPIWDLCHYGYPDDLDPFSDAFVDRFARYCRACAEYVVPKLRGPHFFTPINEITFFSFCAGEWGWAAPYRRSREDRMRLRLALCRAAIAGVKAIREVDPGARMVHIDPLVQVVAPRGRPDLVEAARHETMVDTFLAWDIIGGRAHPEFGGSPEILDIVGANNYSFGQMEYREHGPHAALPPGDERIVPLCEMLDTVWQRYRRPMIIGETSGLGQGRDSWLRDVMGESLAAVRRGMDLQGVCLFPAVDMPDWHSGEWVHNGICDLVRENGVLKRVPDPDYVAELRRWQKELNRVTTLDQDPYSDPVELQDVIDAAHRLNMQPDKNWC